jgi:type IV secretory pathway VirJ component
LSTEDDTAAQAIAKSGALAAEIDSKTYLTRLDMTKEKYHWLVYDAELLSRQLQRERHFPNYLRPPASGL